MSNRSDLDDVLEYLESHSVMSLATNGSGGIWNAAVFYANSGLELFFVSPPDTRHCRNIAHSADVAVTIHEDYAHWSAIKGIQMAATALQVPDRELSTVIDLYKRKFTFLNDPAQVVEKIMRALQKSAWYRVTPSTVFFVNNENGFGNRVEIAVD